MSVLRKISAFIGGIVLLIIGLIIGVIVYSHYEASVGLKEAYRKEDRVKILYYLMTDRYEKMIEKAGFTIPPGQDLKLDDTLESIEIGKEIPLQISPVDKTSTEFRIFFTSVVDEKKIRVVYSLDSNLELTSEGDYAYWNEETKRMEEPTISESEKSHLVGIVQSELRDFFDKMEKSLYG
ncbi:MAG: hypothetical protein Q4A90_03830 [Streptococcus sp.]|nr:hypothetical protein [Streptococcus sp.]